jgi:transcriptional regulator with XRE-family HTH domain
MRLGTKLRELREAKGLSVRKAAAPLGVGFGTLASIESGRSFPGDELFAALATLYGVSLIELLAEEAVDRGRIEVPSGVSAEDVRAAVYRLAGQAAPETAPVDPHAYQCPHCGKRIFATT